MNPATRAPAPTFEELYRRLRALPEAVCGEIIDGSLITSPRPAVPHASGAGQMGADLTVRFGRKPGGDAPGGWWILPEPELHLVLPGHTHVLSPDIAGWRRETLPLLPRTASISLRPDWVCELLSPSTARYDRKGKARIYHEAGVTWRWLVDPEARTVEAYRREGAFWTQLGVWEDQEVVRIEPFDAVELDLSLWWEGFDPVT